MPSSSDIPLPDPRACGQRDCRECIPGAFQNLHDPESDGPWNLSAKLLVFPKLNPERMRIAAPNELHGALEYQRLPPGKQQSTCSGISTKACNWSLPWRR